MRRSASIVQILKFLADFDFDGHLYRNNFEWDGILFWLLNHSEGIFSEDMQENLCLMVKTSS